MEALIKPHHSGLLECVCLARSSKSSMSSKEASDPLRVGSLFFRFLGCSGIWGWGAWGWWWQSQQLCDSKGSRWCSVSCLPGHMFAPALQYDKGLRILLRDPFECRTNPEATEHWPDERSSSLLPHPVGIWHECSTRLLPWPNRVLRLPSPPKLLTCNPASCPSASCYPVFLKCKSSWDSEGQSYFCCLLQTLLFLPEKVKGNGWFLKTTKDIGGIWMNLLSWELRGRLN